MNYAKKIILSGYLLIVLLIVVLAYIWHYEWQEIATLEANNQQIDGFRKEVNRIHIRLIEFSLLGETVLDWDETDLDNYHTQRIALDSTLYLFNKIHSIEHIDSVRYLLEEKDIISPMDFTEYLAQDYDDIRVPVTGIRVKYIKPSWAAEIIAVPVPSFFELPIDKSNPWAISFPGVNQPYLIDVNNVPAKRLCNSEYGGKFSVFLPGVDFSVSALHTWNKMPVFTHKTDEAGELLFTGEHRRMTMLGADASVPVGKLVFRGEFAEYLDEAQTPAKSGMMPQRKNTTNALLGIDFYPGNDWTLAVQYSHKYISGFSADVSGYQNSGMATVKIGKDLLHNTLNLSTFAYVDVTNGGIYNRLAADYAITDQIHAFIGYDFFHADAGIFAMYSKNSEIWLKLKYSF